MRGGHGQKGGHMGRHDFNHNATTTQAESVQADGSVDVLITRIRGDINLARTVSLAKADDGSFSITDARGNAEVTRVVSADADGGVDIAVTRTLASGRQLTQTLELDVDDSGNLLIQASVARPNGNTITHARTIDLATFLGSADEEFTVAEVTEALLQSSGADVNLVGVAALLDSA